MRPSISATASSRFTAPPSSLNLTVYIIATCLVIVLIATCIIVGCLCRSSPNQNIEASMPDSEAGPLSQAATLNLIPPVFYTVGLRDPLMQEDLREKVIREDVVLV
jgi:hypothetical protein